MFSLFLFNFSLTSSRAKSSASYFLALSSLATRWIADCLALSSTINLAVTYSKVLKHYTRVDNLLFLGHREHHRVGLLNRELLSPYFNFVSDFSQV